MIYLPLVKEADPNFRTMEGLIYTSRGFWCVEVLGVGVFQLGQWDGEFFRQSGSYDHQMLRCDRDQNRIARVRTRHDWAEFLDFMAYSRDVGWIPYKKLVTDSQIESLRDEALSNNDTELVVVCEAAIRGIGWAKQECERIFEATDRK